MIHYPRNYSRSRKAQVVLTDRQYDLVKREARDTGKSISCILREGLEESLRELEQRRKDEALERLTSLNAPVDDWPVMKEEILRSRDHCIVDDDWRPA